MSEEAGGFILACAGIAAGGAALATAALGGIVVGAGYLAYRGGYRAVKAGKDAWQDHMKAIEAERQERLQELRKDDEAQMEKLKDSFIKWAQAGKDVLSHQEEQIRQQLEKRNAYILEEERKFSEKSAAWKRISLLDEEMKAIQEDNLVLSAQDKNESDVKAYWNHLNESKKELSKRSKSLEKSQIDYMEAVPVASVPEPQNEELQKDAHQFAKRLAVLRGEFAGLIFLPEYEKRSYQSELGIVEGKLEFMNSENTSKIENALKELQNRMKEAQKKDDVNKQLWHDARSRYFSLQDRHITANQDPFLSKIIKSPLDELADFLENINRFLHSEPGKAATTLEELNEKTKRFEEQVDRALAHHQKGLNNQVKAVLSDVLSDLGYADIKADEKDDTIRITGSDSEGLKGTKASFFLNPEGYLNIDLSGRGFRNQSVCTKEFYKIQRALQKRGIQVDLNKYEHTWMKEMVLFIKDQLVNMGYPENTMTVKNLEGGEWEVTGLDQGEKAEIVIDAESGELKKIEGPNVLKIKKAVSLPDLEDTGTEVENEELDIKH